MWREWLAGTPGGGGTGEPNELQLALDLERDDDTEQRGAFNESRENQGGSLDAARGLWLTRHAFDGLPTDAADANARADDGEAGAKTRADGHQTTSAPRGIRGGLEQRKNRVNHDVSPNRAT